MKRGTPTFDFQADGWQQVLAVGEFLNRDEDGRWVLQVIDEAGLQRVLNVWEGPQEMAPQPIDIDHKGGPAKGWMEDFEILPDKKNGGKRGLYFRGRWNPDMVTRLENGEWRYLSPNLMVADLPGQKPGAGESATNPVRVRPMWLDGAALTNNPALRRMRMVSNAAAGDSREKIQDFSQGEAPAINNNEQERKRAMKSIAKELGLEEGADEAACLVVIRNNAAEMARLRTAANEAAADATLAKVANRLKGVDAAKVAEIRTALVQNEAAGLRMILDLPEPKAEPVKPEAQNPFGGQRVHNSNAGGGVKSAQERVDGRSDAGGAEGLTDRQLVEKQQGEIHRVMNARKVTYSQALALLMDEKPDLFPQD